MVSRNMLEYNKLNSFIRIVNESKRKSNKLQAGKERQFHDNLMQNWLDVNDILIYSPYNEGK